MATVYSLICWGGRTGKVVTLSIASPCVVSSTNHGLRDGTGLVFSTTGALPTGITAGTTYYAKSTSLDALHLYDTEAHAIAGGTTGRVITSGSQSGTHTAKSKVMLDLMGQYPGRWGSSGSERIYDGVKAWIVGRSGASLYDIEVGEVGESFTDWVSSTAAFSIPSAKSILTSMLAGQRSAGWHRGKFPVAQTLISGYELSGNGSVSGNLVTLNRYFDAIEGVIVRSNSWNVYRFVSMEAGQNEALNNFVIGTVASGFGIGLFGGFSRAENNVVFGAESGIYVNDWIRGLVASNNLVCGCGKGFNSGYDGFGTFLNNIAIGNGTNWSTASARIEAAGNNAGLAGEAWMVGAGATRITIATTDFVDYANKDLRPASASSPQVDSGVIPYDAMMFDIADAERPSYNNGGAEAFDVGCYEFDHGYGDHPASTTVTFSGVNAGSEIRVYDASGNELAGVESSTANPELTWVLSTGDVRIVVVHLDYKVKDFQYTPISGAVSLPVQQEADSWYRNPA